MDFLWPLSVECGVYFIVFLVLCATDGVAIGSRGSCDVEGSGLACWGGSSDMGKDAKSEIVFQLLPTAMELNQFFAAHTHDRQHPTILADYLQPHRLALRANPDEMYLSPSFLLPQS